MQTPVVVPATLARASGGDVNVRDLFSRMDVRYALPYESYPSRMRTLAPTDVAVVHPIGGPNNWPRLVARVRQVPAKNALLYYAKAAFHSTFLLQREEVKFQTLLATLNAIWRSVKDDPYASGLVAALGNHVYQNQYSWFTNTMYTWTDIENGLGTMVRAIQAGMPFEVPQLDTARRSPLPFWLKGALAGTNVGESYRLHCETDPITFACPTVYVRTPTFVVADGRLFAFWAVSVTPETLKAMLGHGDVLISTSYDKNKDRMYYTALFRFVQRVGPKVLAALNTAAELMDGMGATQITGFDQDKAFNSFLPGADHLDPDLFGVDKLPERAKIFAQMSAHLVHPAEEDLCLGTDHYSGMPVCVSSKENNSILLEGETRSGKTAYAIRLLASIKPVALTSFTWFGMANTPDDSIFSLVLARGGTVLSFPDDLHDADNATAQLKAAATAQRRGEEDFMAFLGQVRAGKKRFPLAVRKPREVLLYYSWVVGILNALLKNFSEVVALCGTGAHAIVTDDFLQAYTQTDHSVTLGESAKIIGMELITAVLKLPNWVRHVNGYLISMVHQPEMLHKEAVRAFTRRVVLSKVDRTKCPHGRPSVDSEDGFLNLHLPNPVLRKMGIPLE